METQNDSGRFEFKYRISYHQYYAIRSAVAAYMRRDSYTMQADSSKGYFVRSLYYETPDYDIYAQKMAGDYGRVKYRLRSYHEVPSDDVVLRAELKVRRGESLAKYHTFITLEQCEAFLRCRSWGDDGNPILEEFARGVLLTGLKPCVLIDYNREGYASRFDDDVRLTFDHAVRSTHASCLFPDTKPFFRVHHAGEVVLEIKYRRAPPQWLLGVVKRYGLRLVANSKFTQGVEAGRRDRYYPDGVLIVR